MKAVILAGGYGTRLSEETSSKPKPMVEIGGMPILWHIMKYYYHSGVDEFIICLGYKGYMIKEFFNNYYLHKSDVTFDFGDGNTHFIDNKCEKWKVTLVDTGPDSMTGGRLKRVKKHLKDLSYFHFTYGDGLSDVDLSELIKFHESKGKMATMTCVCPPGRFGAIDISGDYVTDFREKHVSSESLINGGFFVLAPKVIDYIDGDSTVWEKSPLENLSRDGELTAFRHEGFWQPMDTLRDKNILNEKFKNNEAPWKIW